MTDLSIIIPAYNVELYIEECIESVLQQDLDNYEIIIVNDGSTDRTAEILGKYKNIENIKIINQENQGAGAARNKGIIYSSGEYIMFLDGDDFFVKNNIKLILEKIKNEKLDILTFNYFILKEGKIEKNVRNIIENKINSGQNFLKESFKIKESVPMPWVNIYNKKFLTKNNLSFNENMKSEEDSELYIRMLLKIKKISFLDIPIVMYRDTPNSLSKNKKRKDKNYMIILKTCLLEVKDIKDEELKVLIYNYMSYFIKNIFVEELKFNDIKLLKENKKKFLSILKKSNDKKYKYFLSFVLKILFFI